MEEGSVSLNTDGNSPINSLEMKLPSIPTPLLINDLRTCPKCEHFSSKNGNTINNIHSTLAYSRCRCHRDWKYENAGALKTPKYEENNNLGVSAYPSSLSKPGLPKLRFCTKSRCSSAVTSRGRHVQSVSFKIRQPLRSNVVMSEPAMERESPAAIRLQHHQTADIATTSSNHANSSIPSKQIKDTTVSSSSITKLPQILSNKSSSKLSGGKFSPVRVISTGKNSFRGSIPLSRSRARPKHFEFTHLLKYVPLSLKETAVELFKQLDQDGDGHLSYAEVLNGLGRIFDDASREVLKIYLKPIYHLLGDATYFGKRDFVLCYCMVKLFREHKLPKLHHSQSIEFYENTVKPLMSSMYLSATEEGTIPIFVIEEIVKDHCHKNSCRIAFRKSKVTNLIEENGLLSLINAFILAPFLFEIM